MALRVVSVLHAVSSIGRWSPALLMSIVNITGTNLHHSLCLNGEVREEVGAELRIKGEMGGSFGAGHYQLTWAGNVERYSGSRDIVSHQEVCNIFLWNWLLANIFSVQLCWMGGDSPALLAHRRP
jgi:hypothetical protein